MKMETKISPEMFCPNSIESWRKWLEEHHTLKKSVWLVYYKKATKKPSISWSEAVDVALCFGWIDSIAKPIDSESYMQLFSLRKPNSTWSKINKDKIARLVETGLMTEAGIQSVELAKKNGSWTILDDVENLILPVDLEIAFQDQLQAKTYFMELSKSVKKTLLQWVVLAKREQTRKYRVSELVRFSLENKIPKQFRP